MTDERILRALQSLGPAKVYLSSTDYADLVEAISEYQWVRRQLQEVKRMKGASTVEAFRQLEIIMASIF